MRGHHPSSRKFHRLNLESLDRRDVPAVIAGPNSYATQAGSVLTVDPIQTVNGVPPGVLTDDFSNTNPNAVLAAVITQGAQYANQNTPPNFAPALPAGTLIFAPNGGFQLIAPSNYKASYGPITFRYRAVDTLTGEQSDDQLVTINVQTATQSQKLYATGAGQGSEPRVRAYIAGTGLLKYDFLAYEQSFTGGVHVATGDLTGDGIDDIAVAPAFGGGPRVQVYDGASGILLEDFLAVDPTFRGGAYVAIGNVDGTTTDAFGNKSTRNDLIVGAGEGGGPRITVYDGKVINTIPIGTGGQSAFSSTLLADFFAYDPSFRGGVQVAAGNTSGITDSSKHDYVVAGSGNGGGPQVRVFDILTINAANPTPTSKFSFFAFNPNLRTGVSVAVGQFKGNGQADIVVGSGDGAATVSVYDGTNGAFLRSFSVPAADAPTGGVAGQNFNGSSAAVNFGSASTGGGLVSSSLVAGEVGANRGGARVAVTDRNQDGLSDIIVGFGPGSSPRVRIFDGNSFVERDNFIAYPASFLGGVFVGGNSL